MTPRQTLALLTVLLSFVIWIPPSDVLRLVFERDDVLLGRYSVDRFTGLLVWTFLLWLLAALLFSRRRFDRELVFRVTAVTGSCLLGVLLVAVLSSIFVPARYEERPFHARDNNKTMHVQAVVAMEEPALTSPMGKTVSRQPGLDIGITYDDVPPMARSYPGAARGYPPIAGTLTTDSRGFRNPEALLQADVVTVGDSFTEGANVSDEHVWPYLLAAHSGRSVYNLGVSSLGPNEYLNNFVAYGLDLNPRVLIMMLFEGNDFVPPERFFRFKPKRLLEDSPLRAALSALGAPLLRILGSINANAPLPPNDILSWMPISVHGGGSVHQYSFAPLQLNKFMRDRQAFEHSEGWAETARILAELRQITQSNNIRFILAYAPHTARLLMPLVRDRVTNKGLHEFLAFANNDLPPVDETKAFVYSRLDVQETIVGEFSQAHEIEFVSLTSMLRERIRRGEQVVFSYDSHWTPLGHRAVALELARHIGQDQPVPAITADGAHPAPSDTAI